MSLQLPKDILDQERSLALSFLSYANKVVESDPSAKNCPTMEVKHNRLYVAKLAKFIIDHMKDRGQLLCKLNTMNYGEGDTLIHILARDSYLLTKTTVDEDPTAAKDHFKIILDYLPIDTRKQALIKANDGGHTPLQYLALNRSRYLPQYMQSLHFEDRCTCLTQDGGLLDWLKPDNQNSRETIFNILQSLPTLTFDKLFQSKEWQNKLQNKDNWALTIFAEPEITKKIPVTPDTLSFCTRIIAWAAQNIPKNTQLQSNMFNLNHRLNTAAKSPDEITNIESQRFVRQDFRRMAGLFIDYTRLVKDRE